MSPDDLAVLLAELQADPLGLGYAPYLAAEQWEGAADRLRWDSPGWAGTGSLPREWITRSDFLLLTLPALPRIAVAAAPVQTIWLQVLETIRSVESIRVGLPGVASMLDLAVLQGILTQAEVDAIRTRPCGRLATLLGREVQVSGSDVRRAWTGLDTLTL